MGMKKRAYLVELWHCATTKDRNDGVQLKLYYPERECNCLQALVKQKCVSWDEKIDVPRMLPKPVPTFAATSEDIICLI